MQLSKLTLLITQHLHPLKNSCVEDKVPRWCEPVNPLSEVLSAVVKGSKEM